MNIEIDLTSLEDFKLNSSDECSHVSNFKSSDLLLYLLTMKQYNANVIKKERNILKIGKSTNIYCNTCFGLYVLGNQEQVSKDDLYIFWQTFDFIKSSFELFKL